MRKKGFHIRLRVYQFLNILFPSDWRGVGISKVFIVIESFRSSSKLLVQARKKNKIKNKEEKMHLRGVATNGIDPLPLPKVAVPLLPVMKLFGKNER